MIRVMPVATAVNKKIGAETKVANLPVAAILPSPNNPETRTKDVTSLAESIAAVGQLHDIDVVDFGNGVFKTADGNRRLTALKTLGMETVSAKVFKPLDNNDAQALFDQLYAEGVKSTKAYNGRDKVNAVLRGAPCFDPHTKSIAEQIISLFPDKNELKAVIDKEITSTVLSIAKKSTAYVLPDTEKDTPTYRARVVKHVWYLLRHPVQQPVTTYIRLNYDRNALKAAIDNNRPCPRTCTDRVKENWNKEQA